MSAVFSLIGKKEAVLAADTLCSFKPNNNDKSLLPRSFTSKIFLLPQFKSCIGVTGTLQAGLSLFTYLVEWTYGIDIDSLIEIDLIKLKSKLNLDYEHYPTGTIYLIGYSYFDETFKGFKLIVDPNEELKWVQTPNENLMFKPFVENWEKKLINDSPKSSYQEFVIDLMRLQKEEDEKKEIENQVGIGGEIVYCYMFIDKESKQFNIVTQIIYQFNDYHLQLSKMGY